MQRINITTGRKYFCQNVQGGDTCTASYHATSDNPRSSSYTDGSTQDWNEYPLRSPEGRYEVFGGRGVVEKVKNYFGFSEGDIIVLDGEIIISPQQQAEEAAEAERQRLAEEATNKGVTDPELSQGVTSPAQTQGVNDPGLMNIINTLISQKAQVQDTGDADIKEFEKQISDLKNQIAQAKEASETAKLEELGKKIEELNTQKAQAQASKETDLKELERQIAELKKPEQSGFSQIPMKIIAIAGAALLGFILLIAVILRGKK